ncbi:NAD(+) diphosphatase [Roseateles sp. BYS180W]|uniref:NAD(+) diphosphatase n=1 Tax=Roseateles rivi TaxID=3299028 RepID=A0ABW7FW01_9BURK
MRDDRPDVEVSLYVGRWRGLDCWAEVLSEAPEGARLMSLRAAMLAMDGARAALASRAAQLLEWARSHRFCGVCGQATQSAPTERALRCAGCGHVNYPRISPAMMALVWRIHEGRPQLLLARSPHFQPGYYSALAGFVEAGESLEDCVRREVAEEVGVRVARLRYFGSQSWPFPHSLMLAFACEWDGGDIQAQEGEIEHAAWFDLDALPQYSPALSISGYLIRATVAWLKSGADPLKWPDPALAMRLQPDL